MQRMELLGQWSYAQHYSCSTFAVQQALYIFTCSTDTDCLGHLQHFPILVPPYSGQPQTIRPYPGANLVSSRTPKLCEQIEACILSHTASSKYLGDSEASKHLGMCQKQRGRWLNHLVKRCGNELERSAQNILKTSEIWSSAWAKLHEGTRNGNVEQRQNEGWCHMMDSSFKVPAKIFLPIPLSTSILQTLKAVYSTSKNLAIFCLL